MDFAPDGKTVELRERLLAFMEDFVYPAEATFGEQAEVAASRWDTPPVIEELKAEARAQGLWNLFLPATHAHGAGLTNLQYAPLAEITGRSPWIAPEALNCSAPDTGNMELLSLFGTAEQQERWLRPLLDGKIRSAFSMTEPAVASSDATNIATRIVRDGDDYVINGRKWWSSGAMSPRCKLLIVMGVTDAGAARHRRQSMICVPIDTPGVTVRRSTGLFGYDDGPHGGHAEISYDDARVPAGGLLGAEGDGFRIAQERLGPGRIHHAMRAIGMAERALELMCVRTASRSAFGKPIIEQGVVQEWISRSRVWIEQVRLLVLKTAWLMDTVGNRGARTEVSAIKVAAPEMATWVIDRAIQAHGGAGVSRDFPLAELYAAARAMRIFDGPDEVHHMAIARRETQRYRRLSMAEDLAGRRAFITGAGSGIGSRDPASLAGAPWPGLSARRPGRRPGPGPALRRKRSGRRARRRRRPPTPPICGAVRRPPGPNAAAARSGARDADGCARYGVAQPSTIFKSVAASRGPVAPWPRVNPGRRDLPSAAAISAF